MRHQDLPPYFRSRKLYGSSKFFFQRQHAPLQLVPYGSVGSGPDADNLGGDPEAGEEVGPGDLSVICRMVQTEIPRPTTLDASSLLGGGFKDFLFSPRTLGK